MRINTNISALNAYRNLGETNNAVSSSMQKLSSGFRINRAADDAAGLGIANRLRADTRAMSQASKNAEQANSVLQIAEGATSSIQKMLERMKELATQAGSDSVDVAGRSRIDAEFSELKAEITRTVETTKFQGGHLLRGGVTLDNASTALAAGTGLFEATVSGAAAGTYTFTQGADGELTIDNGAGLTQTVTGLTDGRQSVNFDQLGITLELDANFDSSTADGTLDGTALTVTGTPGSRSFLVGSSEQYTGNDLLTIDAIDLTLANLGLTASSVANSADARAALTAIDTAMGTVASTLGDIGATQNRLEFAQSNLKTTIQNFTAAESVIRDLDMAEEMTKFSKNNILAQAGTAMLAQANQSSQGVLQLLRG